MCERLLDGTKLDANWETLDHYAGKVDEQIDLLVNYTAGDGFLYRQTRAPRSRATSSSILPAPRWRCCCRRWSPGRWRGASSDRSRSPPASPSASPPASSTSRCPHGSADELGALLAAMGVMRDNIKAMMDREVAQRRSAQARLADALESSQEGVVVVDANDCIVLANAQAADFLGVSPSLLKPGTPLARLQPALAGDPADAGRMLMRARRQSAAPPAKSRLADGRWLRISRSADPRRRLHRACAATSASSKTQEGVAARRPTCCSTPRSTTCRRACACSTRRTGSRSSTGASSKSSSCRADQIKPGIDVPRDPGDQRRRATIMPARPSTQLLAEQAQMLSDSGAGTHLLRAQRRPRRRHACTARPSDGGWVATYEDVTERRQAEAKIMHMARHDALTNLPNRVLFREQDGAGARRAATSSRSCSSISTASRASTTRSATRSATRCCAR